MPWGENSVKILFVALLLAAPQTVDEKRAQAASYPIFVKVEVDQVVITSAVERKYALYTTTKPGQYDVVARLTGKVFGIPCKVEYVSLSPKSFGKYGDGTVRIFRAGNYLAIEYDPEWISGVALLPPKK